ncbi:MAG: hypothetical protein OJF55_000050 [Rhodanobacteraceae bacterium]|nr:MAG: hypothetical protein OJF55_000050 [Rhodanobacteraceae bacterium]
MINRRKFAQTISLRNGFFRHSGRRAAAIRNPASLLSRVKSLDPRFPRSPKRGHEFFGHGWRFGPLPASRG